MDLLFRKIIKVYYLIIPNQVLYENDEEVEVKTGDQIPEDLGI